MPIGWDQSCFDFRVNLAKLRLLGSNELVHISQGLGYLGIIIFSKHNCANWINRFNEMAVLAVGHNAKKFTRLAKN